jgi:hypothetical protein
MNGSDVVTVRSHVASNVAVDPAVGVTVMVVAVVTGLRFNLT